MTISLVGTATNAGSTVTLPTHQEGDMLIIAAHRGTSGAITVPTGWSVLRHVDSGFQRLMVAWKAAASAAETSGTFTNATLMIAAVYRDDLLHMSYEQARTSQGAGATVNYLAMELPSSPLANLWYAAAAAADSPTSNITNAPTGMTNIASVASATHRLAWNHTGANATWNATVNVSITSAAWLVINSGIGTMGAAKAAGGGMLIHPGMSGGMRG